MGGRFVFFVLSGAFAASAGTFLVACTTQAPLGPEAPPRSGQGSVIPAGTSLPCEVQAVLAARCQGCHGADPQFGAPMPLVTRADLLAREPGDAPRVLDRVLARIADEASPMPPPPNAPLTAAERATLAAWRSEGAPPSTSACTKPAVAPAVAGALACTPDLDVRPATAFALPHTTTDQYVCYGFDAPAGEARWITGIAPAVDNATILHHALLYQVPAGTPMSASPRPCSPAGGASWRLVYGWAPGGKALGLPDDVGFPLGGGRYVVQLHLSNLQRRKGERDASGFRLCTTSVPRRHEADVLAFGTQRFSIPPRSTLDLSCELALPPGLPEIHLLAAFPHMHQLGRSIHTTKVAEGGGPAVDLGGQGAWDFKNQPWVPLDAVVQGGDTIRTRCVWANPSEHSVGFGEKTEDEMCYSFTLYYPKIEVPGFHWSLPSAASRCSKTR